MTTPARMIWESESCPVESRLRPEDDNGDGIDAENVRNGKANCY